MFLIPAFLFFLAALLLVFLDRIRPEMGYFWLIAAGGALLAWVGGLLIRFLVPIPGDWPLWPTGTLFDPVLNFAWDRLSWGYLLAVGSVGAAVILAEVKIAPGGNRLRWAAYLFLTGLGSLAVCAGNFYSALTLFTALDLTLLYLLFRELTADSDRGQHLVRYFSIRILSSALLIASLIRLFTVPSAGADIFSAMLFLTGIVLRLVTVFPGRQEIPVSLVSGYDVIPVAPALVFISRWFAEFPLQDGAVFSVAVITASGGTLLALAWASSKTLEAGRAGWLGAIGSLVVLAGIAGDIPASAFLGQAFFLSGAVIFLYEPVRPWLIAGPVLGLVGITGFPFTPPWAAMGIYANSKSAVLMLGLLIHGFLLTGFYRQITNRPPLSRTTERWVLLIFSLALAIPLLVQQWIAWYPDMSPAALDRSSWWPALLVLLIGGSVAWWLRLGDSADTINGLLQGSAGLILVVVRLLSGIQVLIERVTGFLTTILEGEGGVLWALLFLTLLTSLLLQIDWFRLVNGN